MKWQRTGELRAAEFQTREDADNLYIEGYFSVFGGQYWFGDIGYETVDPGAFDLAADTDVRALTNHDTTLVLGRTNAGTLTLRVDERGLWGSIVINPKDQDAVNLYERVKRKDVTQCSFGSDILDEMVEYREDGLTVWHLLKVRLWEVSVCTFPAYEDTGVSARAAELETEKRKQSEKWRADMIARVKGA